ncbi:putative metal-dependent hydrolase [Pedobacter hiemivivus]|uniref:Putative metal-dependent hydrolase n=2 Tax=Pedobacter hiemivivus TaxID=2530454 RepID=A0A4U1G4L7_9SPHI|nr:putative metal-dependent hydrolase [Pedobacter hiemivivus]TKC58647.1 putative metal-dependent hydrolase [Pedobacter hiemivivus]
MYPNGRFVPAVKYSPNNIASWIGGIRSAPLLFDYCIENLDEGQLNTTYRPGGWSIIQVVHHVADSHMNAYIRLKLALTEEKPTISPYDENLWAELSDVKLVPVNVSITLLHALHSRWATLLENLKEEDWTRTYYHPGNKEYMPIWQMTNQYSWHGAHHAEQIISLRKRMGW